MISRLLVIGLFIVFVIIAFGLLTYLLYGRKEKKAWLMGLSASFLTFLSFFIIYYISYSLNPVLHPYRFYYVHVISFGAYGWALMAMGLLVPLLGLVLYRAYRLRKGASIGQEVCEERRQFFKTVAIGLPTVVFAGATVQSYMTDTRARIKEINLTYPKVPPFLQHIKIGQISDFHLGPFASMQQLHHIFEVFHAQRVDRLFITGDLIDDIALVPQLGMFLKEWALVFPQGIDYIYGNHEYYRDFELIARTFADTPMRIYVNEHRPALASEVDSSWPVYIVGVDYPFGRTDTKATIEDYLQEALEGLPQKAFPILLAHHPDFIGSAFAKGIPLTLAGHSHGGQINLLHKSLVPMPYDYWRGLYKQEKRDTKGTIEPYFGYVSAGTGDWFPFRFNCPREATIFTFSEGPKDQNLVNQYV